MRAWFGGSFTLQRELARDVLNAEDAEVSAKVRRGIHLSAPSARTSTSPAVRHCSVLKIHQSHYQKHARSINGPCFVTKTYSGLSLLPVNVCCLNAAAPINPPMPIDST